MSKPFINYKWIIITAALAFGYFLFGIVIGSTFMGTLCLLALVFFAVKEIMTVGKSKSRTLAGKKSIPSESVVRYDPSDYGEDTKCPYCGETIQSELNFCFHCGKSLSVFKAIEPVRVKSIEQINDSLEGVNDPEAKKDITRIRNLTDKIIRKYYEDPDDNNDYSRFIEYYLPKTLAAIEQYAVLCSLENLDSEQLRIKAKLEDAIDSISKAFNNILNRVSTEDLDDVSIDVSVLENVMKQKGLTDPDFTVR